MKIAKNNGTMTQFSPSKTCTLGILQITQNFYRFFQLKH